MQTSQQGLDLIKQFEGFSPTPYKCPAGYWTIGYGHRLFGKQDLISQSEGELLLRQDLLKYEKAIHRLIHIPLSQNQFDALVSFTYNVGSGSLQRSTLRRKLNRLEVLEAADEFPRWSKIQGRISPGLLRRRLAERALFLAESV